MGGGKRKRSLKHKLRPKDWQPKQIPIPEKLPPPPPPPPPPVQTNSKLDPNSKSSIQSSPFAIFSSVLNGQRNDQQNGQTKKSKGVRQYFSEKAQILQDMIESERNPIKRIKLESLLAQILRSDLNTEEIVSKVIIDSSDVSVNGNNEEQLTKDIPMETKSNNKRTKHVEQPPPKRSSKRRLQDTSGGTETKTISKNSDENSERKKRRISKKSEMTCTSMDISDNEDPIKQVNSERTSKIRPGMKWWKELNNEKASMKTIKSQKRSLSTSWEKKLAEKQRLKLARDREKEHIEARIERRRQERDRRLEKEKRKAENELRSMTWQELKNTEKIKKMSKKQLRQLKKTIVDKNGITRLVGIYDQ